MKDLKAVDFLKRFNELCNSYKDCYKCPMYKAAHPLHKWCTELIKEFPDIAIDVISKWRRGKTNSDKFIEVFGIALDDLINVLNGNSIREENYRFFSRLGTWLQLLYEEPKRSEEAKE